MDKTKTILVLEDEKPLLEAASKKLNDANFSVLKARSVNEAVEHLKESVVDAIWLDHYLLGDKNGLDFIRIIRGQEDTKNLPIFVVSNTASPEKTNEYLKLGVNKYYTKVDHRLEDIINDITTILK